MVLRAATPLTCLGPTVRIPEGTVASGAAEFFGTFQGGAPFRGRFFNLIGKGYSQLDGFGFVNAEAAVKAVSKKKKNRQVFAPEQGPHRLPVRALLFVVKCARLAILSFYLPLAATSYIAVPSRLKETESLPNRR